MNKVKVSTKYRNKKIASIAMMLIMAFTVSAQQQVPLIRGNVYGGGKAANVLNGSTTTTMNNGSVGSVYGGGREGSVPGGSATVNINGGYVGYDSVNVRRSYNNKGLDVQYCGVYGGGYGLGTTVAQGTMVNVNASTEQVNIFGSVYGGGEMGQVSISNLDNNATAVTITSDGTHKVKIDGAVFGGGRGYTLSLGATDTGAVIAPNDATRGAVHGNTSLTVGTVGQDTSLIHINSIPFYVTIEQVIPFQLFSQDSMANGIDFWDADPICVYDMNNNRYVQVGPSAASATISVRKTDGTALSGYSTTGNTFVSGVQYYVNMGRVAAAGGGEEGVVLADASSFSTSRKGGNTMVQIHSGTLGNEDAVEVDGQVYGAGMKAAIDGVSKVVVDGEGAWIRSDVYGGSCLGAVNGYKRASASARITGTEVQFLKGWALNVFGGNNMMELGTGIRTLTTIGATGQNDDLTLISESVYGANGYSAHLGTDSVVMYSGKVGFCRAGYDIEEPGDALTSNHYTGASAAKNTVVPFYTNWLQYEGNLYGGGFGPTANINKTYVVVHGGRVKTAVYGGGELASVSTPGSDLNYTYKRLFPNGSTVTEAMQFGQGSFTDVLMDGGATSSVYGGGRGQSEYLITAVSKTPGAVMGNTKVTISGTAVVDSMYLDEAAGGGSVYGGGSEGIVLGNANASDYQGTKVLVNGGRMVNVFGGGRGFVGSYEDIRNATNPTILDRSGNDAGMVYANTQVLMNNDGPLVCNNVYGGGEGCYFVTSAGYASQRDTVALIKGNTLVDIDHGRVIGSAYAGGRIASVMGYGDIKIHGSARLGKVFGGNDISGCVFGAGRVNTPTHHGTTIGRDTTSTYVQIYETPRIGRAFGGGNGDYTYYTDASYSKLYLTKPIQPSTYVELYMDSTASAAGYVGASFGGGNNADVDTAFVYLGSIGMSDTVFGGGNASTILDKARILVTATYTGLAADDHNANYIFGGNNKARMDILPIIDLYQGKVRNVYGGGNAGAMYGNESRYDIFNREVKHLSTYIIVNSPNMTITNNVFGGCNAARVDNNTFVDVRLGTIQNLYGGNDISDTVGGYARIDGNGGTVHYIYGGAKGDYVYTTAPSPSPAGAKINAPAGATLPYCDSTSVNIYGGTYENNIYAGGLAGNCGRTALNINDYIDNSWNVTIKGYIFGGGCGAIDSVGKCENGWKRVGNVLGTAHSDYYSLGNFGTDRRVAYGGGNAGNVGATKFIVHEEFRTNDSRGVVIDTLYGGCRAADVLDTAYTELNVRDTSFRMALVVYGGNDYAGRVYSSHLLVNGGKYDYMYGAGNGDYSYRNDLFTGNTPKFSCLDTVPISREVLITFNNGVINENIYGGGNLGYVYNYLPGAAGMTGRSADPADYGRITINVHNGIFKNNIFTGAQGREANIGESRMGGVQLVYGLKQLNMDGGRVEWSVYGGSQNVNDGYPAECIGRTTGTDLRLTRDNYTTYTTLRPSAIMNLVGGEIKNDVYGGGYRGDVYGSIYINVGRDAVKDSPVWTNRYNGRTAAYAEYKPALDVHTREQDLIKGDLYLRASIYNGANWGNNGGEYTFHRRGSFGGESRILVDGKGYNTSFSTVGSSLPSMHIQSSIIGAGTSVDGGDLVRHIMVRHYGEYNCAGNSVNISKQLNSIQRADTVILDSVAILFIGNQDAYMAQPSPNYSFCRTDTLIMRNKNMVAIQAPGIYIGQLQFELANGTLSNNVDVLTSAALNPSDYEPTVSCSDAEVCDTVPLCDKISVDVPFTKFFMEDGVYVDVLPFIDRNYDAIEDHSHGYGPVYGYAYLISDKDRQGFITARYKTASVNVDDGGFASPCSCENNQMDGFTFDELNYVNYTSSYRTWSVGNGEMLRKRAVTIVAHSDVTQFASNYLIPVQTFGSVTTGALAIAEAKLDLPPADANHFYTIRTGSIDIDQDNGGQLQLLSAAWDPIDNTWHYYEAGADHDGRRLMNDPVYNFGLLFRQGSNFSNNCATIQRAEGPHALDCSDYFVMSGNSIITSSASDTTHTILNESNIIPQLNLYLTYDTAFSSTILRDIKFVVEERDEEGHLVAPIEVTVTIATIIRDFRDEEFTLLAMYNEGYSNEYTRKIVMPASMYQRYVYLDKVKFFPHKHFAQGDEPAEDYTDYFHLTDDTVTTGNHPLSLDYSYPSEDLKPFSNFTVSITPTEDITGSVNSDGGWATINSSRLDLYTYGDTSHATTTMPNPLGCNDQGSDRTENGGRGVLVGILDGRFTAAIDLTLNFNGNIHYPQNDTVGHVLMTFRYFDEAGDGTFTVMANIKTRPEGDTIYLASADCITRNGLTVCADSLTNTSYSGGLSYGNLGKEPEHYIRTFAEALDPAIYEEGDVIAIMDTVVLGRLTPDQNVVLRGTDYSIIQVIRYSGSHYQFPGKECAYRGPMIYMTNNSHFTAYNMRYNGSGLTRVKYGYTSPLPSSLVGSSGFHANEHNPVNGKYYYDTASRVGDTLFATAPMFVVKDNASLLLDNKITLLNNFNMASGTGENDIPGGAIAILGSGTNNPTVTLRNNVTIINNAVSRTAAINNNYSSGAIHIDRGTLMLGNSSRTTKIDVSRNFYIDNNSNFIKSTPGYERTSYATGSPVIFTDDVRYYLDTANYINTQLAAGTNLLSNVFLTRTPLPSDPIVKETISDVVSFENEIREGTRIGITKWFPGRGDHPLDPDPRDTIKIASVTNFNQLYASRAFENHNFFSDSTIYHVFFHPTVSPYLIYFQRCDTYRKQIGLDGELPAIAYGARLSSSCPQGTDSLIFSVHGGFYPYTFVWEQLKYSDATNYTVDTIAKHVSPYSNDRASNDPDLQAISNSDTCLLTSMLLDPTQMSDNFYYRVTASDLLGCEVQKYVDVKLVKTGEETYSAANTAAFLFTPNTEQVTPSAVPSTHANYSTIDTLPGTDTRLSEHHARILRLHRGVLLSKQILMQPTWGDILLSDLDDNPLSFDTPFCEGDVLNLNAVPAARKSFIMWEFDPDDDAQTQFVVPGHNFTITAYFGATRHWKDTITYEPTDGSYYTEYNGDVHIYGERGLAWLISRIDGYNGVQALPFYFKTITVHPKTNTEFGTNPNVYDMSQFLWTPLGNTIDKFRGKFSVADGVTIRYITLSEPNMQNLGFFGTTDSAVIENVKLEGALINGIQYSGGLAAHTMNNTVINNCGIISNDNTHNLLSVISGNNTVGGLVAKAEDTRITAGDVNVKLLGTAIYAGGVLGYGEDVTIVNSHVMDTARMDALYMGGVVGYSTGTNAPVSGAKTHSGSLISNNYIRCVASDKINRAGGIAGYADNTFMANNYVYGEVSGTNIEGSLGAILNEGVTLDHCYYLDGTSSEAVGYDENEVASNISSFTGSGNNCILATPIDGVSNLTRILNDYVRTHPDEGYLTWRSDFLNENHGYPLFGVPDIIPVFDTIYQQSCDYFEFNGERLDNSGVYSFNYVDTALYIDATTTLYLTINESMATELSDSVEVGSVYNGYGFYLSAEETEALRAMVDSLGVATLQLVDSLLTIHGCDSVVTLNLTIFKSAETEGIEIAQSADIKVYPNPAHNVVYVEAEGLMSVEVYDAMSRRVAMKKGIADKYQIDLSACAAGSYYLRITTDKGVAVKKVVKR